MFRTIILGCICFLGGLVLNAQEQLSKNPIITQIFQPEEVEDLQTLYDFFNNQICGEMSISSADCFHYYLVQVNQDLDSGNADLGLNIESQRAVLATLKSGVLQEIYNEVVHSISVTDGDGNYTHSGTQLSKYYNPKGKYISFLQELGKINPAAKEMARIIVLAKDAPPSFIDGSFNSNRNMDTENSAVRLFIAIHFIAINDAMYRY